MPTGTKIKEIRQRKGLTQKQLGDLCGMADSAIRRYENGNANPKIETLQKIADALGCDLSELMDSGEYKLHNIEVAIKKANNATRNGETVDKEKATRNFVRQTLAAHFNGDEYTEEELKRIKEYAEFVKSQRKDRAFTINPPED